MNIPTLYDLTQYNFKGVITLIEIKNLSKVYDSQGLIVEALKNINLNIDDGEIYGIMGLSGAGKSSLLRCINMLEIPTSGELLINGTDVTKLNKSNLRQVRQKIGMIFQHFNLLMNSTVYENIAFPLRILKTPESEINKRVVKLLEVVELSDKKDVYPSQLSGGQKQRVGIARALANNPEIILCDEATSALDPTTTESILALLKSINKETGITIVVITHEMHVIKHLCDKVAVIVNGIIVESGNVVEVFSDPKTETSKRFLKNMIAELPENILRDKKSGEKVIRLYYLEDSANQPVISHLVKEFNIDANILSGSIERIQDSAVGNLLLKLSGEKNNIDCAISSLKERADVRIEVLENGII
jgi:D-methionine transport system ATP-binding protein